MSSRKFNIHHGSGDPAAARFAYTYQIHISIPKINRRFSITEGTLRLDSQLPPEGIKQVVVGDLLRMVQEDHSDVRASDIEIDHFVYTAVP